MIRCPHCQLPYYGNPWVLKAGELYQCNCRSCSEVFKLDKNGDVITEGNADMAENDGVVVDYGDGLEMRFQFVPEGVVPCRFAVGDLVRGSRHFTDRIETVEKVEWVREVWHSCEPYWRIATDCSGGSQRNYWLHAKAEKGVEKELEKAERKGEKEAEKLERKAEKEEDKAERETERELEKAEKDIEKAERKAEKEREKAEREIEDQKDEGDDDD